MVEIGWDIERGEGPLVAVALHGGRRVDPAVLPYMCVDEVTRQREGDPYTDRWTSIGDHRVIAHTSRFQVDLNRPREQAIYAGPDQAWGIDVWREPLPADIRQAVLARHAMFYAEIRALLEALIEQHGPLLVLDLHSYCHRREGPDAPPDDPGLNPEINLCTKTLELDRWGGVLDRIEDALRDHGAGRRSLDVRRDVKFTGGAFVQWVNGRYPDAACCLQIEVKKTFIDEWTGALDIERHAAIHAALEAAAAAGRDALPRH